MRAVKRLHWQELVRRLPDMERSFNQEINLMMSLSSPNIVKLYDQIVRIPCIHTLARTHSGSLLPLSVPRTGGMCFW